MVKFMDDDFLLKTATARNLYHEYAKKMPIFDYHCHIPVKDIAENKKFKNITQMWLSGDHYKWRAMRASGIDEKFITGSASDYEKFVAFAKTLPYAIRNPLYQWTHLELKNYFNITDKILNPETAKEIYEHCNSVIEKENLTPYSTLKKMNVKTICTTDDPTDGLQYHIKLKSDSSCPAKVYPTFRPDKAMALENPEAFGRWIDLLEKASKIKVKNYDSFLGALHSRHESFHRMGCRISDHALEVPFAEEFKELEILKIFQKIRSLRKLNPVETRKIKTALMLKFGEWNCKKGWAMQLHIGAMRNNNSRMFKLLGTDSGYDSICDLEIAKPLAKFLDMLDSSNKLPKTILYNLNPKDNEVLATMTGNFQDSSVPGKLQFGSGWWFLDQKDGMEKQLNTISNLGLLGRFVGMLTDSRSFLSYPRHEYFRRILCNLLGNDIENGELPDDIISTGKTVKDICYNNAVEYFKLPE